MSYKVYDEKNQKIWTHTQSFFEKNTANMQCVSVYIPSLKKREVDTWPLMHWLQKKKKKIAVPKISNRDQISHYQYQSNTFLTPNPWGILEPTNARRIPTASLNAVIVPLLSFDLQGHRVGSGHGYYDQFLAKCPTKTKKIGLSFFPPIHCIASISSYDIALDVCITPEKIYTFSQGLSVKCLG